MIDALIADLGGTARRAMAHEPDWQATIRAQLVRTADLLSELGKYLELTEAPALANLDPFRKLMLELGGVLRVLVDAGTPAKMSSPHLGQLLARVDEVDALHNRAFDRLDVYRALLERAAHPAPAAAGSVVAEDADMQDVLIAHRRLAIDAIERYERRLRRLLSPPT
jgi:hypothetical protein